MTPTRRGRVRVWTEMLGGRGERLGSHVVEMNRHQVIAALSFLLKAVDG